MRRVLLFRIIFKYEGYLENNDILARDIAIYSNDL